MGRSRLLLALALAACDGGSATIDAGPKPELGCQLGLARQGSFTPMAESDRLELILGFQGFLFVVVHAKTEARPGDRVDVSTSLAVDGAPPFGGPQRGILLEPLGAGSVTQDINVFFESSNVSEYRDRPAELGIRIDGPSFTCTARAAVRLVDDDACIHTGTSPICPDAGS